MQCLRVMHDARAEHEACEPEANRLTVKTPRKCFCVYAWA